MDAIRAGKKLSKSRKERKQSSKSKPALKRPMSLMDHLKDRLKARNNLMSGKTEASAPRRNTIKPPPTLDEDVPLPDIGQDDEDQKPDRTGLGLSNVPASMRASMLLLDDPDEMSSGSDQGWNSD